MVTNNLQEFRQFLKPNQSVIGIDYGQKKVGIAVSNQERTLSMPLKTLNINGNADKIAAILDLVKSYNACALVMGLPVNLDGTESEQTRIVVKFAENLAQTTALGIFLQDERLTSKAADSLLKSFGLNRKKRNRSDDSIAAGMILETTLDSINR